MPGDPLSDQGYAPASQQGDKKGGGGENAKKGKKKKKRTKHIQDAEHLRPLREYLAMPYHPPKKNSY